MRARTIYLVPALWYLATPSLAAGPRVTSAESQVVGAVLIPPPTQMLKPAPP